MSTYFDLPFDPSGYTAISGAQLAQLVGGLGPAAGYGYCISTTDDAFGVPTVPDPTSIPALLSFLWLRFGNTSNASATLYIWNPNAATAVTLKNWQIANISSITTGSITGSQIAANTITDNNIFSVGWNKLPSGGAVGGVLIGSMPNPGLANSVIATANLVQNSVTGGLTGSLALTTITKDNVVLNTLTNAQVTTTDANALMDNNIMSIAQAGGGLNAIGASGKLQVPAASASKTLKVNGAGTQFELFADLFSNLLETGIGTQFQIPQVNAGTTGLQWKAHDTLQIYTEQNNTNQSTTTVLNINTAMTTGNADLLTGFGTAGAITFTPQSANSKILIECNLYLYTGGNGTQVGLYNLNTTSFLTKCVNQAASGNTMLSYWLNSTSTTPLVFKLYIACLSTSGGINQFNQYFSTVKITEYL